MTMWLRASLLLAVACTAGCLDPPAPPERESTRSTASEATSARPSPLSNTLPPSATSRSVSLQKRLDAAAARVSAPRTRHLRDDGRPKYVNRLALESSPYLLQHAHNPVDWWPWSPEAFARARELDRPVLLSVGYATCHWCHVMEEESFEDPAIAELVNGQFIPVKVDREQRPDVDAIYMDAVNAMTGRGGWPMTVVMTPEGKPFFAATYLPPYSDDRRLGLKEVLDNLADKYRDDRKDLIARAKQVTARVTRPPQSARAAPGPKALDTAVAQVSARFDDVNGGLRGRTKFPQPSIWSMLLRRHQRMKPGPERDKVAKMLDKTLSAMAHGGIHDPIGGGFHRYTVDPQWAVPHFEKMLYDNAQLALLYLDAYRAWRRPEHAQIVRDSLDYLLREMTDPNGGFYSATDADSEGEEGTFFVWSLTELEATLEGDERRVATAHLGVTRRGNFEGKNVLYRARPLSDIARSMKRPQSEVEKIWVSAKARLYRARSRRQPPLTDDKVLAAWNGLTISALARAALVLDEPRYGKAAIVAANFVHAELWKDGRLHRSHRAGKTEQLGFLDDYAAVIGAWLDLFELTADLVWFERALTLLKVVDEHFADSRGGYWYTSDEHEELLTRPKGQQDGAMPSGNSLMAHQLLRLWLLTGEQRFQRQLSQLFTAFAPVLAQTPSAIASMVAAFDRWLGRPVEIILVANERLDELEPFLARWRQHWLPGSVVVRVVSGEHQTSVARLAPIAGKKPAQQGKATAYVCEEGACQLPTADPDVFARQLVTQMGRMVSGR